MNVFWYSNYPKMFKYLTIHKTLTTSNWIAIKYFKNAVANEWTKRVWQDFLNMRQGSYGLA